MMMMSIALPSKTVSVHPVLIITPIQYIVQLRHLMPQALSINVVQSLNQFDK